MHRCAGTAVESRLCERAAARRDGMEKPTRMDKELWLAEVGAITRFDHVKKACAYAGLDASLGVSAGKVTSGFTRKACRRRRPTPSRSPTGFATYSISTRARRCT